MGRWPDRTGELFPQTQGTWAAANVGPIVGTVVLTEVHYHPEDPDGGGGLTSQIFEFVELHNRSDQAIDLSGWQLVGDTQFEFPDGAQLAAGGSLVITGFDANDNPLLKVSFQLTFGSPLDLQFAGPWTGSLSDESGTVRLLQPGLLVADEPRPQVLVDQLTYARQSPWPTTASGSGRSIQRLSPAAFAGLGSSWRASQPTPGEVSFTTQPAADLNADGEVTADDIDLLCAAVSAGLFQPRLDVNQDGQLNRVDYDQYLRDVLQVRPGDTNLDGVFNSRDLVQIFTTGEYEDSIVGNSSWAEGDWNCDGEFSTSDIVAAFTSGGYVLEVAARSVSAVSAGGAAASETAEVKAANVGRANADVHIPNARVSAVDQVFAWTTWAAAGRRRSWLSDK